MSKKILVTGDSRGVGHTISKVLLEKGYDVVGCSRSTTQEIESLNSTYPGRYTHLNFDFSKPELIKNFYIEQLKKLGPFHGLVNNAAMAYDDISTNAELDKLQQMFAVNVMSPIMLTKYLIRDMLLNRIQGSLIHISSISAHTGYKGLSMYASSKSALEAFSKNVAREWGEKKIRSNVVCPGFMETEMSSSLNQDLKQKIYSRTALKEQTSVVSVANTVWFLLSDESRSITGQILHVDSGTI